MSYGPGRSRLLQGTLVGAVCWLAGSLATALILLVAFPEFVDFGFGWLVVIHALVVIWFLVVAALGPDLFLLVLGVMGVLSSALFVLAGAVTVTRVGDVDTPYETAKVGATVGIGHGFLMVVAFSVASSDRFMEFTVVTRTVSLVLGGFLVPAIFGALGGLLLLVYRRKRSGE